MNPLRAGLAILSIAANLAAQTAVEVVKVQSRNIDRVERLPGELLPYEDVSLRARVQGYVEKVLVDRGSRVRKGAPLVILSAPEMEAQIAEARSRAEVAEAQRAEAEAQQASAQSTYDRLRHAAETPGAVSGNELFQAQKSVEAAQALAHSRAEAVRAARAAVQSIEQLHQYLRVTAPFDAVVTERWVHPGALVGAGHDEPLLRLEAISRLRLVVAVPEADVAGLAQRARVDFAVPAFPGRTFSGIVARSAHALDSKTRTMAVELDVVNPALALAPGMYPQVSWPVRRQGESLLVPPSSIVTTTERTFVIRVNQGKAEWVDVKRGAAVKDLMEVLGALKAGDVIIARGSDEIREGTRVTAKLRPEGKR
jgi:membrane fusion protein (multidrug efflux system)